MGRLVVELPDDRAFCGRVTLVDQDETVLCGPFPVAARASSALAAAHGNSRRDPLFPYGDCPTGNFVIRAIVRSGKNSPLPKSEFGPNGVVMLEGITGEAALADANGRFNFPIHGGDLSRDGRLRSTAGGLRMRDGDLRSLIGAVEKSACKYCEIIPGEPFGRKTIADDDRCSLADPLPLSLMKTAGSDGGTGIHLPRKGTVLIAMSASFVAQSAVNAAPVREAIAPTKVPVPRDVHWVPLAAAAAAEPAQSYNPPPAVNSPTLQGLQNGGNTGVIFDNSTGHNASDVNFSTHTEVPAVSSGPVQGTPPAPPPPQVNSPPQSTGDSAYQQYQQQQQQRDQQQQNYQDRANQIIQQLQQQGQAAPTPPPPPPPAVPPPPTKTHRKVIEVEPPPPDTSKTPGK